MSRKPQDSTILILLTILCLTPFLAKPFHIDDPLFLWAAHHINSNPINFYGFNVNWYGSGMPMDRVMQNPPLTSYFIFLFGKLLGWKEWVLHTAFLLPASICILGVFSLAKRFCQWPLLAALLVLLTPAFLVSSSTVMSDVLALGFWIWAIEFWTSGIHTKKVSRVIFASLLASLCILTKYTGLSLIILLYTYAIIHRRLQLAILGAIVPIIILSAYHYGTFHLYGQSHLFQGSDYSLKVVFNREHPWQKIFTGLSFTGGCFITIFFNIILFSRIQTWVRSFLYAVSILLLLFFFDSSIFSPFFQDGRVRWGLLSHFVVFSIAGFSCISLAVSSFRIPKKDSVFLALWILGIFVFTCFINWTINARALLPIAPPLAILATRRIESYYTKCENILKWPIGATLLGGMIISLAVACGDYKMADSARKAALYLNQKYTPLTTKIFFQGHWGFQYYMESLGAEALDYRTLLEIPESSIVIIPMGNTNIFFLPRKHFKLLETVNLDFSSPVSSLDKRTATGFYADVFGPLPYAFETSKVDSYLVFQRI